MLPASRDRAVVAVVDGEAGRRPGGGDEDVMEVVRKGIDGLVEGVELGNRRLLTG